MDARIPPDASLRRAPRGGVSRASPARVELALCCRRSIAAAGRTSRPTGAATGASGSSSRCFSSQLCSPSSSPTTSRSSPATRASFSFPVLVDYPESKFGGFLAITDYKDPVILDEIEQPTAGCCGRRSATPTPRSTRTIPRSEERGGALPRLPGAAALGEQCALLRRPADQIARYQALGNRNWLGTDDQGRDVLARIIYGFRISVIFGLLLTGPDRSIIGITAGAVQGYFGGRVDLDLPALPRDLVVDPVALRAAHHLGRAGAGLLDAARRAAAVQLGLSRRRGARRVPARPQLRVHRAARALGLSNAKIMFKHLLPNAMVATLTFLPFKLSGSVRR